MVLLDITFYFHNLTYLKRIKLTYKKRSKQEEEEEKGKTRRRKGLIFSKILKKVLEE